MRGYLVLLQVSTICKSLKFPVGHDAFTPEAKQLFRIIRMPTNRTIVKENAMPEKRNLEISVTNYCKHFVLYFCVSTK